MRPSIDHADYPDSAAQYDTNLFRSFFKTGMYWSIFLLIACAITQTVRSGLISEKSGYLITNLTIISGLSICITAIFVIVHLTYVWQILMRIILSKRRYARRAADGAFWSNLFLLASGVIFFFWVPLLALQAISALSCLIISTYWLRRLHGKERIW